MKITCEKLQKGVKSDKMAVFMTKYQLCEGVNRAKKSWHDPCNISGERGWKIRGG